MINEVAQQQNTSLTTGSNPTWLGSSLSVDSKIPRLLLMQAVSEYVKEEKAKNGDIIRSTNLVKVGGYGKALPVILLSYPHHEWIIEVKTNKKFEFKRTLTRTAQNQNLPWKFYADEDGNVVSETHEVSANGDKVELPQPKGSYEANRVRVGSFYALLPGDMDAFLAERKKVSEGGTPDLSVEMTAVQIRCRSFSYDASLGVEKMLQKIASFKCEPWQFILELGVKEMKNEDNSWFVFDFDLRQKGSPISDKYKATAKEAFEFVQANMGHLNVDQTEDAPLSAESTGFTGNDGKRAF